MTKFHVTTSWNVNQLRRWGEKCALKRIQNVDPQASETLLHKQLFRALDALSLIFNSISNLITQFTSLTAKSPLIHPAPFHLTALFRFLFCSILFCMPPLATIFNEVIQLNRSGIAWVGVYYRIQKHK